MANPKWQFFAQDNGGKRQNFKVSAGSKQEAIKKGMDRARRNAAGDITDWECHLILGSL